MVVDGANVVGSRPNGWWRDRAGAARRLHRSLAAADPVELDADLVVLVLEGAARAGQPAGREGWVETIHAQGSGDDLIADEVRARHGEGHDVVVVTADRQLRGRVSEAGGTCVGPSWLLDHLA